MRINNTDTARLLGIANGYEIAYRRTELRLEVIDSNALRKASDRIVELVIGDAMDTYGEVFSDDKLREAYTQGLFFALKIDHPTQNVASQ